MSPTKEQNASWRNVLTTSGLSGKTVTGIDVYKLGSVDVVEINYTGGPQYLKHKQGVWEFGGTSEWDTGTKVSV
jgi:hypothetical protein